VEKFLTEHPGVKPGHYDFNGLLASAYSGAFQSTTVCNSFAKLACSLLIGILLQMKQLLWLLSLKGRIQMTMGLE